MKLMQKLKPLKSARADLEKSLNEWFRAKESFESENGWSGGRYAAQHIVGRISEAADVIQKSLMIVRVMHEEDNLERAIMSIYRASVEMADAVHDGTDNLLDQFLLPREIPEVFVSWQAVCAGVDSFAQSAAKELNNLKSKYPREYYNNLSHAAGSLVGTAIAAKLSRKRGIRRYLQGPLSKYALEDARLMGLLINKNGIFWRIDQS